MVHEQLLSVMSDDVRAFVLSRQVKNSDECSNIGNLYYEMNAAAGRPSQMVAPTT